MEAVLTPQESIVAEYRQCIRNGREVVLAGESETSAKGSHCACSQEACHADW